LCCAAALETIKIYEDDNLIENVVVMGNYITERVEAMKAIHPSIGNFRTTGLLGPVGGIMIADYYFIRKQTLEVSDLYSSKGIYSFNNTAIIALISGI
jgi:adenosylmethionine-8-amino-7-oxononanoate aminotransferase